MKKAKKKFIIVCSDDKYLIAGTYNTLEAAKKKAKSWAKAEPEVNFYIYEMIEKAKIQTTHTIHITVSEK